MGPDARPPGRQPLTPLPPAGRSTPATTARENPSYGCRRIHGELATLSITVAPSTVWEILHAAGINPTPERTSTWAQFPRSQADAILAADFFDVTTLTGARLHILALSRR